MSWVEEISSFVNSDKELKENIKKLEKYGDIAIQLSAKREKISEAFIFTN